MSKTLLIAVSSRRPARALAESALPGLRQQRSALGEHGNAPRPRSRPLPARAGCVMGPEPRVRDADATRRRILDAATAEFSAAGLAGARTARIAETARSNQRMIYAYYGSKDGLFDAVLEHHITVAQHAVTLDAADLPGYAQQVFDFYRAHPHLVRLAMWQSLERPELMASLPAVAASLRDKAEAISRAQTTGQVASFLPADRLLEQILTLAHGSIAAAAHAETWTDRHRDDLGVAVAALTRTSRVACETGDDT